MNRFEAFRALHRAGRPLFLPNAWDRASAAALAARGFPAIGTTSLGVAAAAGLPDAAGATRETTLWLARDLVRLPVLVSVDIEGGFGSTPEDVAELAAGLERLGVAGVNIEDGRPGGAGLTDPAAQCELIAAVKRTAPGLFVNARTDTYWLGTAGRTRRTRPAAVPPPTSPPAPTGSSCPAWRTRASSPRSRPTSVPRSTSCSRRAAPDCRALPHSG